jgi:glycosyltransferase involved in cell wall biosynthesis
MTAAPTRSKRAAGSKPPDLSVVIPTRNSASLLAACLHSLKAELRAGDFEAIVVDDGSADAELRLVEASTLGDSGAAIRLVRLDRVGPAAARNAAATIARGEWLLFLDDDVVAPPGFLARARSLLAEGVADVIGCPDIPRPNDSYVAKSLRYLELASRRSVERRYAVKSAVLFIRRSAWDSLGGFESSRQYYQHEDTDLVARARGSGLRVLYDDRLWVHHRAPGLRDYLHKWRLLLTSTDIPNGLAYYRVPHTLALVGVGAGVVAAACSGRLRWRSVSLLTASAALATTAVATRLSRAEPSYFPGILAAGLLRLVLMPVGAVVYVCHRLRGRPKGAEPQGA